MDLFHFFSLTIVSVYFLFIEGVTAGTQCYNTYYGTTHDCRYGCCGDYYDHDYGCCSMTGTIAGAVVGAVVFIAIIVFLIYFCHRMAKKGKVIKPQNTHTTTVVAPPPQHQPGAYVAPPPYQGAPGGPTQYGQPQPQMYPPPPPQGGMYNDPAYPPTN